MENGLFRKKSMERIASPEALHDYMRVTSPRLWMLLGAIAALLAGFIVYASTTTMESLMPIRVEAIIFDSSEEEIADGKAPYTIYLSSYLPYSMKGVVDTGMMVRIGDQELPISLINEKEEDDQIMIIMRQYASEPFLADGEYDAELVLESTTPISFLWN